MPGPGLSARPWAQCFTVSDSPFSQAPHRYVLLEPHSTGGTLRHRQAEELNQGHTTSNSAELGHSAPSGKALSQKPTLPARFGEGQSDLACLPETTSHMVTALPELTKSQLIGFLSPAVCWLRIDRRGFKSRLRIYDLGD